jgi:CRP/FNR family transcriptional regulator, cyclic AMP receptor protein
VQAGRTGLSPFLDTLEEADRRRLQTIGVVRRFARGAAIAHAGTAGDRVIVIQQGHVKLTRVTDEGRDVLLGVRGPGDLIGEQSALDGEPRSASIVAIDPVEALAIPAADFLTFVAATPAAALAVMRLLNARLRDADAKRVEFAAQDVIGRLSARLVELSERFGRPGDDGVAIDLPLTQEDLAGWVGASREAASRALQQMRSLGWVTTSRRAIVCHDLDALARRAAA